MQGNYWMIDSRIENEAWLKVASFSDEEGGGLDSKNTSHPRFWLPLGVSVHPCSNMIAVLTENVRGD